MALKVGISVKTADFLTPAAKQFSSYTVNVDASDKLFTPVAMQSSSEIKNIDVSKAKSTASKAKKVAEKTFLKFPSFVGSSLLKFFLKGKNIYSVGGKAAKVGKRACNIFEKATPGRRLGVAAGKTGNHFKILNALEIPFNIFDAVKEVISIPSKIKIKDLEGLGLSAASIGLLVGDTFDAVATMADYIITGFVGSNPVLSIVSQTLLPLGMVLVTGSSALKVYKLGITAFELHRVNRALRKKDLNKMQTHLDKLAGMTKKERKKILNKAERKTHSKIEKKVKSELKKQGLKKETDEYTEQFAIEFQKEHDAHFAILTNVRFHKEAAKLKKLKTNRLQRRTNGKVAKILTEIVNDPEKINDPEELQKALKMLKKSLIKTTCVHSANILTNMIILAGLALFFAPVPPIAPFVLLGVGALLKLGITVGEEYVISDNRLIPKEYRNEYLKKKGSKKSSSFGLLGLMAKCAKSARECFGLRHKAKSNAKEYVKQKLSERSLQLQRRQSLLQSEFA